MTLYYAVLWTLVAAAFLGVAVYLAVTLVQVRNTARELEVLARKATAEMDKVGTVTAALSGFAGAVGGSTGRLMAGTANLVYQLFQRYRREKPVDVPSDEGNGGSS